MNKEGQMLDKDMSYYLFEALKNGDHFKKEHWMSSGFQPSTFEQLLVKARYKELKEWQKFIVPLHDEVKIKNDLVYCKHTGELIGFANLGEINNSLVEFEKQFENEMSTMPDIASHMLVFMVYGVTTTLEHPVAHFPSANCITADFLFRLFGMP